MLYSRTISNHGNHNNAVITLFFYPDWVHMNENMNIFYDFKLPWWYIILFKIRFYAQIHGGPGQKQNSDSYYVQADKG